MSWKTVLVLLARNREFPEGSSERGYEIHIPLDADSRLDRAAIDAEPWRATIHRLWNGKNREAGQIVRTGPNRWAFSYTPGKADDEEIIHLGDHLFLEGEYLSVKDPQGHESTFRIDHVGSAPH